MSTFHLPFFETGPILTPQGDRIAAEVTGITSRSEGFPLSVAEKIRSFILGASEVGSLNSSFTEGYSFFPRNDTSIIIYAKSGEVYDRIGRSFPILRRCYALSNVLLESIKHIPTLLIRQLIELNLPLTTAHTKREALQDIPLKIEFDHYSAYQTLDNLLSGQAVEFIEVFCKLASIGRVHVVGVNETIRVDFVEGVLAALPQPYRTQISFSLSSTNPQNPESARILFVDGGTPVDRYQVSPSTKLHFRQQPDGLLYILRLDQLHREQNFNIEKFVGALDLPRTDSAEDMELGRELDLALQFADQVSKVRAFIAPSGRITAGSDIGLSKRFRLFLNSRERFALLSRELDFFARQLRSQAPKPEGYEHTLIETVFELALEHFDLYAEFGGRYTNLIVSPVVNYAIHIRHAYLLDLAIAQLPRFPPEFESSTRSILISKAVSSFVDKDQVDLAWRLWCSSEARQWVAHDETDALLEAILRSETAIKLITAELALEKISLSLIAKYKSFLGKNLIRRNFPATASVLTILVAQGDPRRGDTFDILGASWDEMDRNNLWLRWSAQQLITKEKYIGIGRGSFVELLSQGESGIQIVQTWCDLWKNDWSRFDAVSEDAYGVILDFALRYNDPRLATIPLWFSYRNFQSSRDLLEFFVYRTAQYKSMTACRSHFRTRIVEFAAELDSIDSSHHKLRKSLMIYEFLVGSEQRFPTLATKYLGPLLAEYKLGLSAQQSILRVIMGHGELNWLIQNVPTLLREYIAATLTLALEDDRATSNDLLKVCRAVWLRNEIKLNKAFLRLFETVLAYTSVLYQESQQRHFLIVLRQMQFHESIVNAAEKVVAKNIAHLERMQRSLDRRESLGRAINKVFRRRSTREDQ